MRLLTDQPNVAAVAGTIASTPTQFTCRDEVFCTFKLDILRSSGTIDTLMVTASKYLLKDATIGDHVAFNGQIRTYQKIVEDKSHLQIAFFATEREIYSEDKNTVELMGFICKPPQHRFAPLGREICDLMVAVNRVKGRSDYIPCVVWGRLSKLASELAVGNKTHLTGRLQSRVYKKALADGSIEKRTAYELSVSGLQQVDVD